MHQSFDAMAPRAFRSSLHKPFHRHTALVHAARPEPAEDLLLRAALLSPLVHTPVQVCCAPNLQVYDLFVSGIYTRGNTSSMSKRDEAATRKGKGPYRGSQRYRCSPQHRLPRGPSASPLEASSSSPAVNTRESSLSVGVFHEKPHITYSPWGRARVHIYLNCALTLELDERLSRLAIVKPTHISHLIPMHSAEYVAARERLRIRHFHLIAAPLPRRRNPVTLSCSPGSSGTIRDWGERFRLCATVEFWGL
jgi:hypothetical protein